MSKANNFFEAIKNNPKEIKKWCIREIKEYQKLLKLIEEYETKQKKNRP